MHAFIHTYIADPNIYMHEQPYIYPHVLTHVPTGIYMPMLAATRTAVVVGGYSSTGAKSKPFATKGQATFSLISPSFFCCVVAAS